MVIRSRKESSKWGCKNQRLIRDEATKAVGSAKVEATEYKAVEAEKSS